MVVVRHGLFHQEGTCPASNQEMRSLSPPFILDESMTHLCPVTFKTKSEKGKPCLQESLCRSSSARGCCDVRELRPAPQRDTT